MNPSRGELTASEPVAEDGQIDVPDGPGLGIEIDRSVLDACHVA